jgi:hypothetical protein
VNFFIKASYDRLDGFVRFDGLDHCVRYDRFDGFDGFDRSLTINLPPCALGREPCAYQVPHPGTRNAPPAPIKSILSTYFELSALSYELALKVPSRNTQPADYLSTIIAIPMPPPMHMLTSPV